MSDKTESKNKVARRHYYSTWAELCKNGNHDGTPDEWIDEAMEEYRQSSPVEPSSPDKIDEAISYFEEIKSERESKKEDDTVLINYVLIILKSIKQRSPTVKESETGEQEDDFVLGLAKWLIENRRSVFIEADISHSRKKAILYKLGYSSDIIE